VLKKPSTVVDYFILLIGTRIGGWFGHKRPGQHNAAGISARIRVCRRQGKLKIITFVRAEVLAATGGAKKKSSQRIFPRLPYSETEEKKRRLAAYPSKFARGCGLFCLLSSTKVGRHTEEETARATGKRHFTPNRKLDSCFS